MKVILKRLYAAVILLCILSNETALGGSYTFLNPPGSVSSRALGVDGDTIFGRTTLTTGNDCGFVYDGTNYTLIDPPGASWSGVLAADSNNVIGVYYNGTLVQGFLFNGSSYTNIPVPGSPYSRAEFLSGNRIVVTCPRFLYQGL